VKLCNKTCKLNKDKTGCQGCGRTLEEIKSYGEMARAKVPANKPVVNMAYPAAT
jgi:predicted Fe-S protein YdhL (DUF1289 family)